MDLPLDLFYYYIKLYNQNQENTRLEKESNKTPNPGNYKTSGTVNKTHFK